MNQVAPGDTVSLLQSLEAAAAQLTAVKHKPFKNKGMRKCGELVSISISMLNELHD